MQMIAPPDYTHVLNSADTASFVLFTCLFVYYNYEVYSPVRQTQDRLMNKQ